MIVAKNRNGHSQPGLEMVFLNNLAKFENAAPQYRAGGREGRGRKSQD
jgi:hypothetical protein